MARYQAVSIRGRSLLRDLVIGHRGLDVGTSSHPFLRFLPILTALVGGGVMERSVGKYLVELAGRNASPHTLRAYKSDLACFIAWLGACDPPVSDPAAITRDLCLGWLMNLREKGYASSTLARRYAAMRSWVLWLSLRGVLPVLDIPHHIRRDPSPLPTVPTTDAVQAMLAVCDPRTYCGVRDRAILEFLYSTACRASELCELRMDDLHLDRRTANVLGKGRKERIVVLGDPCRRALKVYLNDWRRPALDAARRVFLTRDGERLSPRCLHKIVARVAHAAGLTGIHPHSLRHGAATHMSEHGADVLHLRDMLGHASVATTQIYVTLAGRRVREEHREHHPRA